MAVRDPITLDQRALRTLQDSLRGELVLPGDAGYDDARSVWNGSIDRHPALVARCAGVADVRAALRFGVEQHLPIALRGGGHNIAGFGTCDGGIVIDLRAMRGVRVDPATRTAVVEAGAVWGEVDHETNASGLAVTGGVMSTTGVAGFTLGGGIGWLMRADGLACDSLLAVRMVSPTGDLVRASESENPELFWALRGGGGNFGVVTSFEFTLRPVTPQVYSGLVAWDAGRASDVFAFFGDFMSSAPDDVTVIAIARTAPAAPFLPESVHGRPIVALAAMHAGSPEDGERALAPLRSFSKPVGDALAARPYPAFNAMFDASWAPGFQNYWKAEYLSGFTQPCADALAAFATEHTSPLSDFKVAALGGAVSKVGEDDTAYGHRSAPYLLNVNTRWTDAAETPLHVEHTRRIWEAAQPYADGGAYVNFMGEEGAERVRAAYGDAKFERLQRVKRVWDPRNVLAINQNIPPR